MLALGTLGQLALAQLPGAIGIAVPSPPIVPAPPVAQYPDVRLPAGPKGYDGDDFLLMQDAKIGRRTYY